MMGESGWPQLMNEVLIVLIATGWIILIGIGLEPDKPLSGGLPGHVDLSHHEDRAKESTLGVLGEYVGWIAFGLVCVLLVVAVIWIIRVHGGGG